MTASMGQGTGMSKSSSSPLIRLQKGAGPAPAYSLRAFSTERKRFPPQRTSSLPNIYLDKIDLIGGNGGWRQRRAEEEFAHRAVEEEHRLREQQELEERRRRRKAEFQAKKRRQREDEELRRAEERERTREEQLEREEARRQAEEQQRVRRELEEAEWLARQPKTCQNCAGSGKCPSCLGSGQISAVFLSPFVQGKETKGNYGRIHQGCDICYGFKQGLMADLKRGTGRCNECDGWGKIAPDIEISPAGARTRKTSNAQTPHSFFMAENTPKAA